MSALEKTDKQYEGSCYIAVVESGYEDGRCRDTIEAIKRFADDTRPQFNRYTKGYEGRQAHLNKWYEENQHAFILFLDGDMTFPDNTLERLRSHKKAYVSGMYMRRQIQPMLPIWFENNSPGDIPFKPLANALPDNSLFEIGASGWGCVLLHRDVVTATKSLLKGELEIIEDDMDVYPYDLKEVLAGHEQLKPLRGVKNDLIGSDIRFAFFAKLAGFQLYGDSGVQCGHMLNYPVIPSDYISQPASTVRDTVTAVQTSITKERERIQKAITFQ